MSLDFFLVMAVIAVAAFYVGRRFLRSAKGKGSCGCGSDCCSGAQHSAGQNSCTASGSCGCSASSSTTHNGIQDIRSRSSK